MDALAISGGLLYFPRSHSALLLNPANGTGFPAAARRLLKFSLKARRELTMLSSVATRNFFSLVLLLLAISTSAIADTTTYTGAFADGATYLIEVPLPWNGTLLLYSHGYVAPGSPNPAHDVGDPATRAFLLANGFALAGSSYANTGWAIQEGLMDQIAVLDVFAAQVGSSNRTIAWGTLWAESSRQASSRVFLSDSMALFLCAAYCPVALARGTKRWTPHLPSRPSWLPTVHCNW
jgi:hypothetical protein